MTRRRTSPAVERVRELIAAGEVYQANVCRVLSAPLPDPDARPTSPGSPRCSRPATRRPYAGFVRLPTAPPACPDGCVATASPELFLRRAGDVWSPAPSRAPAAPRRT